MRACEPCLAHDAANSREWVRRELIMLFAVAWQWQWQWQPRLRPCDALRAAWSDGRPGIDGPVRGGQKRWPKMRIIQEGAEEVNDSPSYMNLDLWSAATSGWRLKSLAGPIGRRMGAACAFRARDVPQQQQ